ALEVTPDADVSLLLSLPDEPRVAWSVRSAGDRLLPAEPVPERPSCVALATGRTAVAPSSTEMGACGHLRESADGVHDLDDGLDPGEDGVGSASEELWWEPTEVAALCLPLVIGERNLGVLCVTTAPGELPDRDRQATLEHVVHVGSARLESLRRRRGPSTPGPTDPVTGLPTEVALRARAGELTRSHQPWCLAVVRVDGADEFRHLHGPHTWDDAMRLIADTTSTTLRPDDVVVRLDGERVAAVLSGCSTAQAAAALERARESLVLAHTMAGIEHFTCSVGLVDGTRTTSIDDGIRLADAAGHAALLQGGNRVVVADASII
ncbi:MAG: diguanylate cyclase, partial [Acidimicrobiia bacterium]